MSGEFELGKLLAYTKKIPIVTLPAIIDYIPQKPPIVMVDRIFRSDTNSVLTGFYITENNIFVENGKFNESGLIENIAQSAASGVGLKNVLNGLPIPIGFIGAVKNLHIFSLPVFGTDIYTIIEEIMEVFGITIIQGTVFCETGIIASCEMKVAIEKTE